MAPVSTSHVVIALHGLQLFAQLGDAVAYLAAIELERSLARAATLLALFSAPTGVRSLPSRSASACVAGYDALESVPRTARAMTA